MQIKLFAVIIGISLTVAASAATWTGAGGTNTWSTAGNWDTGVVPDQNTEANIDGDAIVTYNVSGNFERSANAALTGSAALSISGKRFLNGRNAASTFSIADRAQLTHSGEYFIVGTGHPGTLNQTGGTVTTSMNRAFFVADAAGSAGSTYNLTGGALNVTFTAQESDSHYSLSGNNAFATFYINGGDANFTAQPSLTDRRFYLKRGSVLQVDSGSLSLNNFKWVSIGRDSAEESAIILNGGAITLTTRPDGALIVGGQSARGRIAVNGGVLKVVSPNGLWVGDGSNCIRGIFEQAGGEVVIEGGDVVMGPSSTAVGSYYRMDGGTLTARDLYLHANADPSVKFIFNAGEITLQGDRSGLVNEPWFVAAAGTVVQYDAVNDVTTISRIPYAHEPIPTHEQINVGTPVSGDQVEVTLSWLTGLDTDPNGTPGLPNAAITKHRLYMSNGTAADPNLYLIDEIDAGNPVVAEVSYGPLTLLMDRTYTWRVDEVVEPNVITGPVWSFSTPKAVPAILQISPADALYAPGATAQVTAAYASDASEVTAVTWYRNDTAVNPSVDGNISVAFSDSESTLTIASLSEAYEGSYYCIVTNLGGDSEPSDTAVVEMKKLAAWYAFENDVTDSAADNDGTLIGDPNFVTGRIGQAISLNGTSEAVSIPRSIGKSFTIELWVKTTATGGTGGWWEGRGLVDGEMPGSVDDFGTVVRGSKFGFGVGNPDVTISSTSDINDNQWHYCVATRDGLTGEMIVYVDGERQASANGPTGPKLSPPALRIGSLQTDINYLAGQIDEVKLYNYPLDELTIAANYTGITGESVCIQSQRPDGRFDLNGDCVVDLADFVDFIQGWLECGLYPSCN